LKFAYYIASEKMKMSRYTCNCRDCESWGWGM